MQTYKNLIDVCLLVLVTSGLFLILLIVIGTPEVIGHFCRRFQTTNTPRNSLYAKPQE